MTLNSTSQTDRATGYYWIIFPYPNNQRRWEPGSWDANAKHWAVVGSNQPWFEFQLLAVGPAIGEAPPLPPHVHPVKGDAGNV